MSKCFTKDSIYCVIFYIIPLYIVFVNVVYLTKKWYNTKSNFT